MPRYVAWQMHVCREFLKLGTSFWTGLCDSCKEEVSISYVSVTSYSVPREEDQVAKWAAAKTRLATAEL